jgi:hypothetical protein
MEGATIGTCLEMLRVIKFVLGTENYCLKIRPKFEEKNWNLKVFCGSGWAGDPETRISVTGILRHKHCTNIIGFHYNWELHINSNITEEILH